MTSCYKDSPQDSWKQIVDYMHEMYPEATDKQIRKDLQESIDKDTTADEESIFYEEFTSKY